MRLGIFPLAILLACMLLPATAAEPNADSILADTKGLSLMNQEKYKDAIAAFDEAIHADASNWAAYVHRSKAYLREGKYKEALASADKAIELQPKNSTGYVRRGEALFKMNQLNGAVAELNKALSFNPSDGEAYFQRAKVYAGLGRMDLALKDRQAAAHYDYAATPGD